MAWRDINSYPQVSTDSKSQNLYLEQRMGRQLDVVRTYYAFGQNQLTANDVYFADALKYYT